MRPEVGRAPGDEGGEHARHDGDAEGRLGTPPGDDGRADERAEEEADAGDAAPTDAPGSDFWRQSGMQILWGAIILLAGGAFAWYAIRSSRRRPRAIGPIEEQIPEPAEFAEPETAATDEAVEKPDPQTRPEE